MKALLLRDTYTLIESLRHKGEYILGNYAYKFLIKNIYQFTSSETFWNDRVRYGNPKEIINISFKKWACVYCMLPIIFSFFLSISI